MTQNQQPRYAIPTLAIAIMIAGALCWSYWPVFVEITSKWANDPQYSHSYLVPLFSLFLLWRNQPFATVISNTSRLWGTIALIVGVGLRLIGSMYYFDWFEAISILPMLAGTVLLVFGSTTFWKSCSAIAFLFFMIPLPYRIETGLSLPLQRLATMGSTFILQIIGQPAFAEGNIIAIDDARIGVVDACNGLGMFLLFFAMATAVTLLVNRPLWEKILLIASAAPIAVGVNIGRITVTSLLHVVMDSRRVDALAHDFAGWLMMPIAIVVLGLELKLLSRIFIEAAPMDNAARSLPRGKTGASRKREKSVSVAAR